MPLDYVVYKLTFPNGKTYVGKDIGANGHSLRYFGSWFNANVEKDFTDKELRDFTIRKEIIFESKFPKLMDFRAILERIFLLLMLKYYLLKQTGVNSRFYIYLVNIQPRSKAFFIA